MLGKLFGSNSRVKILKLFLLHPEKRLYLRQIARDLKLQLNSVRRELENLENFGLLVSSFETADERDEKPVGEKAGKPPYATPCPTPRAKATGVKKASGSKPTAARAMAGKQERKYYQVNADFVLYEEIKALVIKAQVLYEKDFINKLRKAGRPKLLILTGLFVNDPSAAVDLLIVGRFNKAKLFKLIKELENEIGSEINFTFMDMKEFKYRRDITDVFLYDVLERKKMVVIDEM